MLVAVSEHSFRRFAVALIGVGVAVGLGAVIPDRGAVAMAPSAAGASGQAPGGPKVPVVLDAVRRTPGFTQGLVYAGGLLYESLGLYGESVLRVVDPSTGRVLRSVPLPSVFFGEGLALSGNELVQLTWHAGRAVVYRYPTLERVGDYRYSGEGWGLCRLGGLFVMSDGSSRLTFRDVVTFAPVRTLEVRDGAGNPVAGLNELECARGVVYANQWRTPWIVAVDPESGLVVDVVDLSVLMDPPGSSSWGVANGIAFVPATDTFYVTGKGWPFLYRVRF